MWKEAMEAAKINWESVESVFVADETYENINAPQWVDLLTYDHHQPSLDAAWFCKPDCKHPNTAEDFLRSTPNSSSKLLKSVSVSKLIGLGDWSRNRGEPYLKRRKPAAAAQEEEEEDGENQNPNVEEGRGEMWSSSRNGGRDLLGKISDFYNELKKMGTTTSKPPKDECCLLVEQKKQKPKTLRRRGDEESNGTPLSLDITKKGGGGEVVIIRTSPPTPQCFSATTLKPPRRRLNKEQEKEEREPLQEIQLRQVLQQQEEEDGGGVKSSAKPPPAPAASALDVFWFFKPCANSAPEF